MSIFSRIFVVICALFHGINGSFELIPESLSLDCYYQYEYLSGALENRVNWALECKLGGLKVLFEFFQILFFVRLKFSILGESYSMESLQEMLLILEISMGALTSGMKQQILMLKP